MHYRRIFEFGYPKKCGLSANDPPAFRINFPSVFPIQNGLIESLAGSLSSGRWDRSA
jgi:hypothetical protein